MPPTPANAPSAPQRAPISLLVPAAGRGARTGLELNKILAPLRGRPLLSWTLEALLEARWHETPFDPVELILVARRTEFEAVAACVNPAWSGRLTLVEGGDSRHESVENGARAASGQWLLVHDAARPFVSSELIEHVAQAARRTGAALPALPASDTVKRAAPTLLATHESEAATAPQAVLVEATLERERIHLAQTPQIFERAAFVRALDRARTDGFEGTDCASLCEHLGLTVEMVPGQSDNFKITLAADLERAEHLLERRARSAPHASTSSETASSVSETASSVSEPPSALARGECDLRVGIGYDSHRLEVGEPLILAGVRVPFDRRLVGHSDADLLAHALTDAVCGACGLPDIGRLFPDTDPRWRGANSMELLAQVAILAAKSGWRVVNADCVLIAQRPKIADFVVKMRKNIARALQIEVECVNLRGKTGEGLDDVGAGLGMQSHAAILARRMALVSGSEAAELIDSDFDRR